MRLINDEVHAPTKALAHALSLLWNSNYNQLLYDFVNADPGEAVAQLVPGVALIKLAQENRWALKGDMTNKLPALETLRAAESLRHAANHIRNAQQLVGSIKRMTGVVYIYINIPEKEAS